MAVRIFNNITSLNAQRHLGINNQRLAQSIERVSSGLRINKAGDDVAGLAASEGILTTLGGRTSHAAVVARQMNKVCIVGCRDLVIERNRRCRIGAQSLAEGDLLSLDGHSGAVYAGELVFVVERPLELLSRVKQWQ